MPYPKKTKEPAIIKVELPWYKQLSKDLKMAISTIKYNKKRYISFLLVILLLQSIFSSVLILNKINNTASDSLTSDKYDYHLDLKDLNDAQAYYLVNEEKELTEETKYYKVKGMQRGVDESTSQYKYDIQIEFIGGSIPGCYRAFVSMYYGTLTTYGDFTETFSPLFKILQKKQVSNILCVFACVLITVFAFVMIYILFSVMTNHYKFTYGIYQSFGANFKKLFSNSIAEFIIINAILFVPSAVLSNAVCLVISLISGLKFVFCWYAPLLGFVFTFIASGIAVFVNMRSTASKTPNELIMAADNANHITSPRDSEDLEDLEFPRDTTLLSFKRFRKYYVKLVCGALVFSILFVSISFISKCYDQSLSADRSSFTADFKLSIVTEEVPREELDDKLYTENEEDEEEFKPDSSDVIQSDIVTTVSGQDYDSTIMEGLYKEIPSLKIILKSCSIDMTLINSHVVFDKKQVSNTAGVKIDDKTRAYSNVSINSLDKEMIKILKYLGCNIEGSLEDVIDDPNTIAISDSFSNSKKFKFKVGDKIKIATDYVRIKNTSGVVSANHDEMLREYLNSYDYTYTEYTIGAIIKDLPTTNILPIYAGNEAFEDIVGYEPYYDHIDIILNENVSSEDMKKAEYVLRSYADFYENMTVTETDSAFYQKIEQNKNYPAVFSYVSFVLLLVVPIIYMFSQILFYLKRKQEFDVFFALGAENSQIRNAFIIEGIMLTVISAMLYTVISLLAVFGIKHIANSQMWQYIVSTERMMRFQFSVPIFEFVIGLLVVALSAFLSAYIPYRLYRKSCHPIFTVDYFNSFDKSVISGSDEDN